MVAEFTLEEVARHNVPEDAWIVVDGDVVDISKWIPVHPGGELVLKYYAGKDASDAFLANHHGPRARAVLRAMVIGRVKGDSTRSRAAEEFRRLHTFFEKRGFFRTDMRFYMMTAAALACLFVLAFCLAARGAVIPCAVVVALFWQQAAFVGHDSNHHAITHTRQLDDAISLVVSACIGIGGSWWSHTHNVHHNFPNSVDIDPDIQFMPLVAPSDLYLQTLHSKHHGVTFHFDQEAKAWVTRQHLLFLPLLSVARFGLYLQSFKQLMFGKAYGHRVLEFCALGVYWSWYLLLLASVPTWGGRLLLLWLSHAAFGVLHLQLVLSHFCCPTYKGYHQPFDFLTASVVGTMNWSCPRFLDWFHGGLQFQIEHHVFPRMPRHRLREAADYLQPLCQELGLPYYCPTFFQAINMTLASLHGVARKAAATSVKAS